jgi:hypothetical protein
MVAASRCRRRRRLPTVLACLVGIIVTVGMTLRASHATFSATTSNSGNTLGAAAVALSDDDGGGTPMTGTAMFAVTNAKPGDNGQSCITVTYGGNVASTVKVYATSTTSTLSPYLDMVIEQGTGGSFASCTGFSGSTIYTGTLNALGTTFGTGAGTWSPGTSGSTQVYRISWALQDNYSAQGRSTALTFTWEAQNS